MKIEHIGLQVDEPGKMAEWYCRNLGFAVKKAEDAPVPVRFILESGGGVMLEIYRNPAVTTPDYDSISPLQFHVAFLCGDLHETVGRLERAGAKTVRKPEILKNGDAIAMLRDPWGITIQLCKRASPLL